MRAPFRRLGPLVVAARLCACGGRTPEAEPLNLVLVTLDTTRADRIGCYGARSVETPRLDALAAQGVRFDNAISAAPLTLPAHCTLFTSLLPGAHGVRDN